jgi:ankyrin
MACYKGHVDVVLYLLDTCNVNANTCDNSFNTPLLYAAMGGHWDIVSLLLDRNCDTDQCNREGATLSLLACKSGNIALIHELEALNVFSCDKTDYSDRTVLHYSCMSDNVELLKHLITRYQLSIDVKDRYGITPLHIAAKFVSSANIEHIISIRGKESLLDVDNNGMSPIHHMCYTYDEVCGSNVYCKISAPRDVPVLVHAISLRKEKETEWMNTFLKTNTNSILFQKRLKLVSNIIKLVSTIPGFSINSTTYDGKSLLHLSCYSGNMLLVKLLEQYNISTTSLDYSGSSPVHYAALSGSPSLLHYIVTQYSLNINQPNYNGMVPLAYACQSGRLNAVEYVINSTDVNINTTDNDGMTSLHHSCRHGHLDVCQYLINTHGSDVYIVDSHGKGCNVLDHSAFSGNQELVQYFINEHKFLPTFGSLQYAVYSMKLPLVKEFIDVYHVDPHGRDSSNGGLTHYVAITGDIIVLEYLMKCYQCDLTISDDDGWNIFHWSAVNGHIHFIKHVIEHYPQCISLIHLPNNKGRVPLHYACQSGNTQLVMLLVDDIKCNVTAKDDDGRSCVYHACVSGNLHLVKLLIHQYNLSPLATNKYGQTSLHASIQYGRIHIFEWISHEYNIDMSTDSASGGATLLHVAAFGGYLHSLQHLINKYQCDINAIAYGLNGYTPLHYACKEGHFVIVSYLTSLPQCNVSAKTSNQSTVLHLTCESGSLLILKHLVDNHSHELDLCAFNDDGVAPIHLACQNGTLTIIQYIIEHSPKSLDLPDVNGYTPLLTAAYYKHLQVIKYLNSQRCNISVLDGRGFNVLHVSAENGCLGIVKYLIEGDYCDPNITDYHNRSSLHIALINDQLAIVDYLMDSPNYKKPHVQFDLQDVDGNSPLHIACDVGQPNMVSILCRAYLSHNKNILQTNNKGWTPLHCAAAKGHVNTATALLEATTGTPFHNGLLQSADKQGQTVFHIACINGQYRMFLYISSVYPDSINTRDDRGRGLLHGACQSSSLELVQYLVETHKLDTEWSDRDGVTCLHLIADRGDIEMYRYLVSRIPHQFSLIPVNNKGRTPLHYSCLSGQYGMSLFLIKTFRVHPEDKDNKGFTPLHAACQSGNRKLVVYFLKDMKCKSSVKTKSSKSLVYFASKSSNLGLVRLLVETYKLKVQPQDIEVAKSEKAESIVQYLEISLTLDTVATQLQEKGLIRSQPLATN